MKNCTKYWRNVLAGIGPAVLVTALLAGNMPRDALAKPARYTFTPLAFLGDLAPGPEGNAVELSLRHAFGLIDLPLIDGFLGYPGL